MLRFVVAVALLVLSQPALGMTLADLVQDGGFTAPNETLYSDFRVKIKGGKRLSRNLADYEVTLTDQGFVVSGGEQLARGDGRLILKYVVSARTELPIENAMVMIDPQAPSSLKAKRIFRANGKKVGKLKVKPGKEMASIDFSGFDSVKVKDVVSIWNGFPGTSSADLQLKTAIIPEPGTGLLVAGGLAAMAALRSARRR